MDKGPKHSVGTQIGNWIIVDNSERRGVAKKNRIVYSAKCKCGSIRKIITISDLKRATSCSKCNGTNVRKRFFQPLTLGQKFGKWTVIELGPRSGHNVKYLCECECGYKAEVEATKLRTGKSAHCFICKNKSIPAKRKEALINDLYGNNLDILEE